MKKDVVSELRKIIEMRPGTGDSDINVLAIEYPVPYWLIDGAVREIERSRSVDGGKPHG